MPTSKLDCNILIHHTNKIEKCIAYAHSTLLESLVQQNIAIRKSCNNGTCGICLTKLLKGTIDYNNRKTHGLNLEEIAEGYILPCIAYCLSDIELLPPKIKPITHKISE